MIRLSLFLGLALLTLPVAAQTALEPIAAAVRAQALLLPAETPLVSLTPADAQSPRQSYSLKRTFAADGTFTLEWNSGKTVSSQTFRPDGTLLKEKQTDVGSGRTLEATSDAGRTTLKTVITEQGVVRSEKTATLRPGIALREEMQHLVLQAWSYGVRDGLKFQSLSPDGGMVGDFQILFRSATDLSKVSDKYSFPDEFRAALSGKTYVVADMMLQGIGAFFYPHHFYLVYLATPSGLQFAGYFGEDPKAPVFQYVPRS